MTNCTQCERSETELDEEVIEYRWILNETEMICDDCWEDLLDDIGERGIVLADYLEMPPYEIRSDGDNRFTVSPGRIRRGTLPAKAR